MTRRLWFLIALLAALTFCQSADAQTPTWKNDAQGRPAPPCMLLDPITGISSPCSTSNPIPTAGGSGTGTTSGTSLTGFGKAWYPSTITGATANGEQMIGVFIDDINIALFRRSTTCANCLQVAISPDGGITGTFVSTTGVISNSLSAVHRVPSATPRYLVSNIGGPLAIIQASSLTGTWTTIGGLATPIASWASNADGSTVLSSDTGGTVCRSSDNGVSFGNCVAGAGGGQLAFAGGTTWLVTNATTIRRSIDNGASWATVFTSGTTKTSVVCLAPALTVCLASGDGGETTRSTDSGATWPTQVDTGLGSPSQPQLCDYGGGNAVAINLRSAPTGLSAVTTDTHSSFNSGVTWFPGTRFGSAWDGTGTPSGRITCRGGRGWVGINVTGGGAQIFGEYNPLTAPGGTLQSSAGGYVVAAPIQSGNILNRAPLTSAANTAAVYTLTNTAGSRICIREIALISSAASAVVTLTITDGATVVVNYGTPATGIVPIRFVGNPLICSQTSNNLVVNIGAAGGVITTTTSVVADRYPN